MQFYGVFQITTHQDIKETVTTKEPHFNEGRDKKRSVCQNRFVIIQFIDVITFLMLITPKNSFHRRTYLFISRNHYAFVMDNYN